MHQKFRSSLYVPQPDHCPVPLWRLKGNAEARVYGSEGSSVFVEKSYNFKSGEPSLRWIGTTTFYLRPKIMRVPSERSPKSSTLHPQARGGSSSTRFRTADECPKPDPIDTIDALETALHLESAVNGNRLGVRQICNRRKSAAPFSVIAAVARANESDLEIIADAGSEEDSDMEVRCKECAQKIPSRPVSLITANGPMDAGAKHPRLLGTLSYSSPIPQQFAMWIRNACNRVFLSIGLRRARPRVVRSRTTRTRSVGGHHHEARRWPRRQGESVLVDERPHSQQVTRQQIGRPAASLGWGAVRVTPKKEC